MKIVLCTGGFDPLHSGHIEYFKAAKKLGDVLVVGVNSDSWLTKKKGSPFMPITERVQIIDNLKVVDHCILFDDSNGSAVEAIRNVKKMYPNSEIIFANGGDRTATNIPEMSETGVTFVFGVGGDDKKNSSSWILDSWKYPKTDRPWGYYRVLHTNGPQVKLKELTVQPGQRLSMQRHGKRTEFWFVTQGTATVYTIDVSSDIELIGKFTKFQNLWIANNQWHQLVNESTDELKLIEIQYGEECTETDIERS